MAWQLIYTSAPRSLEAGRSGFGTVARHRAISPMLVSAIERTSQFSRLPGVDVGRVIFCHRIIAVAGGRFHVLSSIRDAGADYTGRTNHIAHHLVADPREIAQLGTNGPSPADVLLAMQWATSWNEHPRYFEAPDEIALAAVHPQVRGSAWQLVTGNSNQAWLLASGDARRGAYVIQPTGVDLREIFAESLRLMPDRLWQTSFTTSLQPSDESADFRWIGIEECSPLRTQAEGSGRVVMDLGRPEILPIVELAEAPLSPVSPQRAAPVFKESINQSGLRQAIAAPITGFRASPSVPGRPTEEKNDTSVYFPSRRNKWLILTCLTTAVIAITAGILLGFLALKKYQHGNYVRAEIEKNLIIFDKGNPSVATNLTNSPDIDIAAKLASATFKSVNAVRLANFSEMQQSHNSYQTTQKVESMPLAIKNLDELIANSLNIHKKLTDLKPESEAHKAIDELEKIQADVKQLTFTTYATDDIFLNTRDNLVWLAKQKSAEAILSLLKNVPIGRSRPDESIDWFNEKLYTISSVPDGETAKKIIDDWKFIEAQELNRVLTELESRRDKQTIWPNWLVKMAQRKIDTARGRKVVEPAEQTPSVVLNAPQPSTPQVNNPSSFSSVPLYFVNGKDNLSNFRVEEISPGQSIFLKSGINGKEIELQDLNKDGNLRRSLAGDVDFQVNAKSFIPARGADNLTQPFRLSAKDAVGNYVFHLWVTTANGTPLFGTVTNGLSRKGDLLVINPSLLGFSGTPQNILLIKLANSCFATATSHETQVLANWSVDLAAERKQLQNQQVEWKKRLEESKKQTSEPPKDVGAEFNKVAETLEKAANFADNEKKLLADNKKALQERCGGYIMAVTQGKKKIEGLEDLFKNGVSLKTFEDNATADAVTTELSKKASYISQCL